MSREVTAMTPYYGSNRASARRVGELLGRRSWVGVPFLGSGTELRWIDCRAGVGSDLNHHVINLAKTLRDPLLRQALVDDLACTPFHVDELSDAQDRLRAIEATLAAVSPASENGPVLDWARDYFVAAWMTRSASAGTGDELTGPLAVRWTSSGGDSAVRYRSAVEAIEAWGRALACWNFVRMDGVEFVGRCRDDRHHAVYADPPWTDGPGDKYAHTMSEVQHGELAAALLSKRASPIVVRIGDTPTARRLYPAAAGWTWERSKTRSQANADVAEALVCRNLW